MKFIIIASFVFISAVATARVPGVGEGGGNSRCSTPIVTCDECEKKRLQECGINMTADRNPNPERTVSSKSGKNKRTSRTSQQ